jgi:hypothetical protein
MKYIFSLLSLSLLAGCGSHSATDIVAPKLEVIVTKDNKNIGGTVVYNPHGLEQLVNARRNSAMMRMREICGNGHYKITQEETAKPEERDATYEGNPSLLTGSSVRFVDFDCVYP